ncbi:MAG: methionine biosynthesis protein MetW [Pseudomonadota bacterium]
MTLPDVTLPGTQLPPRVDFDVIADFVPPGARVLDIGCGAGDLLALLESRHGVDGRGIELEMSNVSAAVGKGLAVIQGDADSDLADYPDQCFDYVILSQTIQATRNPKQVLAELLRIGRHAIVSFPNFGFWQVRAKILFGGRMPVLKSLPYSWYDTPNIHFCTILDFVELCRELNAEIDRAVALNAQGGRIGLKLPIWVWNIFGAQAVFLLKQSDR